ncbi:hypothetical protein GJAV_G00101790 [Gymnothorax javanicus]|nr:hypothetical protein GJAV_G00101790 [Gymnothorax javanicus]
MLPLLCRRATLPGSAVRLVLQTLPAGPLQVEPRGLRNLRIIAAPHHRWVSTSCPTRAEAPRKPGPKDPPLPSERAAAFSGPTTERPAEADPLQDTSVSLAERFKRTFKQYGKVMIPVHILTSSMWFGMFYYAAMKGVNVVPFLEMIGCPEKMVDLLRHSQGGYALTAYAICKIATPARYTVTLGGTSLLVKYLRKKGYMSTPPPVKGYLQDKMEATKERITEKMEETKDKFAGKLQETKDRVSFRKKVD